MNAREIPRGDGQDLVLSWRWVERAEESKLMAPLCLGDQGNVMPQIEKGSQEGKLTWGKMKNSFLDDNRAYIYCSKRQMKLGLELKERSELVA